MWLGLGLGNLRLGVFDVARARARARELTAGSL